SLSVLSFLSMIRLPTRSTLFPYTTLFRSFDFINKPSVKLYEVGDTGPAGGIVFYDKGSYSDDWRYLEAAPSDQTASAQWGCLIRSEEHTSELQSRENLVCRLLLEKKNKKK